MKKIPHRRSLAILALLMVVAFVAIWRGRERNSAPSETSPTPIGVGHDTAASSAGAPIADAVAEDPAASALSAVAVEALEDRDRFAAAAVLDERWLDGSVAGVFERWRLVSFDDRVVRVVDEITRDAATGAFVIRDQQAMLADELVVGVPTIQSPSAVAARIQAFGHATLPAADSAAVVQVRLPEITLDAVPKALADLRAALPELTVDPNFLRFTSQTTSSDYRPTVLWGLARSEAPAAWTVTTGSASVVVAVIDSGIDTTHPDLAANLWVNPGEVPGNGIDDDANGFVDDIHGWNFASNNGVVSDLGTHGTHVAGIIGAVGDNGVGITGVNWNVRLMTLRAGNSNFPDSALLNSIRYVTTMRQRGVNVVAINASWGGSAFSTTMRNEIASAGAAGVMLVAAVGNNATNNDLIPTYPASYELESILAVAAMRHDGLKSGFSDYGRSTVDLVAPGTAIYSTLPGGTYGYNNGASMAAPHVTGAIALIAAVDPGLSVAQMRARLLSSVERDFNLEFVVATSGRLNLRRAVAPELVRPRVKIVSPAAEVVAMDRVGLSLELEAALQPEDGVTPSATLTWDVIEGPAAVTLTALDGANTTATFASPGLYRLRVRASANGLTESDEISVAVAAAQPVSSGLRAWWRFEETSGPAIDSSGESRTGTLTGTLHTTGVLGRALHFNGSSDHVSFSAPSLTQLSIAGWVRADQRGNSIFPRIVHMRPGLLFFGLDEGVNADDGNYRTLKFALDDGSGSPVWHSQSFSVNMGQWRHVAVSFDPTASDPMPRFFVNGVPRITGVQTSSASPPAVPDGVGFLGDQGDNTRNWQGLLDEIRIYDRELSSGEVAWLAHEPAVHALTSGTLKATPLFNPVAVALDFAPTPNGLDALVFTQVSWSAIGSGLTVSPSGGMGLQAVATASGPGDYIVRFDATTLDGTHVVRTLDLSFVADSVEIAGYYTGRTSSNGHVVLVVRDDGSAVFMASGFQGLYETDFTVAPWGFFSFVDATGRRIEGRIAAEGRFTGTIFGGTFEGERLISGFGDADASRDGEYAGWLLNSGVRASAFVERGRIALVVGEPGAERLVEGVLATDGSFSLTPTSDAVMLGKVSAQRIDAEFVLPDRGTRRMVLLREGFSPPRRLANISVRGRVGSEAAVLIGGFFIEGEESLPVLVRGIGPTLVDSDLGEVLATPQLNLRRGDDLLTRNAGWSLAPDAAAIASVAARIGAFALDPARADAALLTTLPRGGFTGEVVGNDGGEGLALVEIYDAREGEETARLVNLSARGRVGTGDDVLIGGFFITGDAPLLVLVRAAGPALTEFNVPDVLAVPEITLYRDGDIIAQGFAWESGESAREVALAIDRAFAFQFAKGSKDAALLAFLEPGGYTALVRGSGYTTGIALVEIYAVPDP